MDFVHCVFNLISFILHREISRRQGKLTQRITFDVLGRMTNKRTAFNDLGSHALPLIDKHFDYDKVGNLIQQVNGYGNYPAQTLDSRARYSQRYEYDAAQQVVMQREYTNQQHFVYDPAGNLFNEQGDVCRANQLRQYNGYHYDYDGFGRLIKRQRPAENITQWFSYNHEHQLIEARVESLQHRSITRYQYDALGRRINKTTEHYDKYSQRYTTTGTDFSWQGMRLSGEANAQQKIRYLYNGQDYEPIARVISDRHPKTSDVHYQIEYFHTLANSLPTELTNEEGEIIWLGEYTLFGQLKHQRNRDRWYSSDKTEQNLRFAGQYYDQETGLHYNTLRYYDPNCGRFTQQDPIGLAGGINLYQYAPNTLSWIDPWGLKCSPEQLADNRLNGKNAEEYIAEKLGKKSNIQVLGTQVYVKTPGLGRGRYIDILVQDLNTGKITAIEVKYNGATRSALQEAKDKAIEMGKNDKKDVIFGKKAPRDKDDNSLAGMNTAGITTKVINVSPKELAEWLR